MGGRQVSVINDGLDELMMNTVRPVNRLDGGWGGWGGIRRGWVGIIQAGIVRRASAGLQQYFRGIWVVG